MLKRLTTSLFCLLIFKSVLGQQDIVLKGSVKDLDHLPLPGATITVEGTNYSTTTDRDGQYQLKVKPGSYKLIFSFIGFNTTIKNISTSSSNLSELNVRMQPSLSSLQQVEVMGRKEQSYKTTRSFIGKAETDIKDIPQSVSYASKEFIADRGLMRVGDIVRNLSGVTQASFYDDLTIRGFRVNGQTNTQLINGLRTSTGFWKQPLANYLERVEVLKGPSSALFGNASPGGVVNRVTKKPLDETRRSVNFSLGSFNTFRGLADFTGPASKDSSLLYRLNLGYENAGSFRDLMFDKNIVIAPSLTFLPTDKTSINFDLVYNDSKSRLDRGQTLFGSSELNSTPQSLSLNTANDYMNELTYNVTISINHKITDILSLNAAYIKTGYEEDLYEHRTSGTYGVDKNGVVMENMAGMMIISRKRKRYIDNMSGYLNYKPQTGVIKHNIVVGYDFGSEKLPVGSSQMTAGGYLNKTRDSVITRYVAKDSLKYARDKNGAPIPNVPHFNLSDPLGSQKMIDDSKSVFTKGDVAPTYYYLNAGYVQNQFTIGKLQALLGIRYEYYTDFANYKLTNEKKTHSEAWLPRLGLVYSITPNINLYGSYVEGYNPQTAATIANPEAGGPFDPLKSNMKELGAKTSWFRDLLTLTVAAYEIRQTGALYNITGSNELRQIGDEKSKGVELDVIGRVLPNWSVMGSYSYSEAIIVESSNPGEIGLQKPNAPKNTANFWSRYNFTSGLLKGFGIGAGFNYVDKRNLNYDSSLSPENQLTIPQFTLFNAAAYYNVGKLQLQLNASNIGNKKHWVGGYDYFRIFPGTPESYLFSIGYSF